MILGRVIGEWESVVQVHQLVPIFRSTWRLGVKREGLNEEGRGSMTTIQKLRQLVKKHRENEIILYARSKELVDSIKWSGDINQVNLAPKISKLSAALISVDNSYLVKL